jgi:hypothetical protein
MQTALAVREDEVLVALAEIGFQRDELDDAIRYGEWARASCHPFDPPGFPGSSSHAHRIRRLALLTVKARGWTRVNDHGMAFLLSPDRKVAITSCRGNEDTANPERQPRSKFKKGIVAATLAKQNRVQFEFDEPGFGEQVTTLTRLPNDTTTFYLLVDRRDKQVFAELSVPVRVEEDYIVEWKPRIILGSVSVRVPPADTDLDDDIGADDDLDIPIDPVNGD